ncbi:hypothetical protein LTR37_013375 [Vermiconidia calcicola]|uniref:Uncharacterized protein n=1 Tax=Vermiconidia calcicola TaxID=1690605 RepID=A0ACC3MYE8_9PEZI|nr:hypothetical protein LTR37_013375 [Vermiconidia calcicola]
MALLRSLMRFAQDVEDVAAGLNAFRDRLPRDATRITAIISELFAVSSVLREIENAHNDRRYAPSFYRIEQDLALVLPSLRRTLDGTFEMFARARERPYQMVWDDLDHRMEREEGAGLLRRLEWYHDFLRAQLDVLTGYTPQDLRDLRRQLVSLFDAQDGLHRRIQRLSIDTSASTPRPMRPPLSRLETPISPTTMSDDWDRGPEMPPPLAPDPPPPMPTSPTFTSSSSQTLNSSQTSYSSDRAVVPIQPAFVHWAQDVFDGQNPGTEIRRSHQVNERSACFGTIDNSSLHHLVQDGFLRALEISFDRDQLWVRLYIRPSDNRSRILIMTKDATGPDMHYCTPLTNLKIIRDRSSLQLCRVRREGRYTPWARLNFYLYERMVLFYCTFVAMKRQDRREIPHDDLLDEFELEGPDSQHPGDEVQYDGMVRDGDLRHALRLYKDRSSGVVRLEAAALRGPMKDVPLWTAFVTRYANDPDWAHHEGGGVVSLIALRPPPYVFLSGYEPPKNRSREYILQFQTTDGRFYSLNFQVVSLIPW